MTMPFNAAEDFKDDIGYLVKKFYERTGVFVNSIQISSIDVSTIETPATVNKREITKISFQAE